MQTFSAVQISFANKITSRLECIKPIDVKQWDYSLLPHNPLPQPNFDVIAFNMILTSAPSHYCKHWMIKVYLIIRNEIDLAVYSVSSVPSLAT